MSAFKPTFLIILDGWGLAAPGPGNAVSLAATPTLQRILAQPLRTRLACSGRAVGLPDGFMGNSEVGHLNIGAGRVVYQDMTRIDLAIETGALGGNPVLLSQLEATRASGGTLHLMGLLSDGGVHSHILHLFALLDLAARQGVPVCVHAFMDGRDTSPTSGAGYVRELLDKMAQLGHGRLGSLIGRYYAMDRDKRWDRTEKAWDALTLPESAGDRAGAGVEDPVAALEAAYAAGETDEFIKPRFIRKPGEEKACLRDGDSVFFFNFRADRARQLSACLFQDDFAGFQREARPKLASFATMTLYDEHMAIPPAFAPEALRKVLGEAVSDLGLQQLRIAETEKYAHVTYFFNGGEETPFAGEEREMVPSPREVPTYDLKPEMSARKVKNSLLAKWREKRYPFVVCNFANADMVGHTGVIPAAIKALETLDECLEEIWAFARENGIRLLVTADHGNAEEMLTPQGSPMTAHTLNPVPFVILDEELSAKGEMALVEEGKLGDIAPTILQLWGERIPAEMTGKSLLKTIRRNI